MKGEVDKDLSHNPDYLENKFTPVDGFQMGYFISKNKVMWFLNLEKYGSDKSLYLDSAYILEAALT